MIWFEVLELSTSDHRRLLDRFIFTADISVGSWVLTEFTRGLSAESSSLDFTR